MVIHLQIARTLRSITQGIAVVDLALYLKELHWSAAAIGGTLSTAGIVGAALILFVGIMSDRWGRKPFLVTYESLMVAAAALMALTTNPVMISAIIIITGFGRGQNGAAGPFTPAEQAWMASRVPRSIRGRVFSTNTALGFFGMAMGSAVGGLPHLWASSLPGVESYRPLFWMMCVLSAACTVVIATAPSGTQAAHLGTGTQANDAGTQVAHAGPQANPSAQANYRSGSRAPSVTDERGHGRAGAVTSTSGVVEMSATQEEEKAIRTQENRNMVKLAGVNMLNGLAVGFIGPMMSYWFATKFGVSSAQIGTTLALSFVLTGMSSLVTGFLTQKFGMVRSVVWLQVVGVCLILTLPLMPSFVMASTIYIVRSAFSRGTQGARSALSSSLTRDARRGFSVSMNSLAMRIPSAIGPTLSGYMLDMGIFSVPFFIAGGLQLTSTLLYGKLFRRFDLAEN